MLQKSFYSWFWYKNKEKNDGKKKKQSERINKFLFMLPHNQIYNKGYKKLQSINDPFAATFV